MVNALAAVGSTDTTSWSDTSRVSDAFAQLVFPLIYGQPLLWRDLNYNGGVDSTGVKWSDINWEAINWDTITWEDIYWEGINWEGINWESVAVQDINWESTFEPLSGSRSGWAPLN